MPRKTKIICTLGPAVDAQEMMEGLIKAGMNVARFNFSHGDYEEQGNRIETFKKAREAVGLPVAMLLDTKGPEIRIGKFATGEAILNEGDTFTLLNEDVDGDNTKVSVTYKNLYNEVTPGTRILINDGLIEVIVEKMLNLQVRYGDHGLRCPRIVIEESDDGVDIRALGQSRRHRQVHTLPIVRTGVESLHHFIPIRIGHAHVLRHLYAQVDDVHLIDVHVKTFAGLRIIVGRIEGGIIPQRELDFLRPRPHGPYGKENGYYKSSVHSLKLFIIK